MAEYFRFRNIFGLSNMDIFTCHCIHQELGPLSKYREDKQTPAPWTPLFAALISTTIVAIAKIMAIRPYPSKTLATYPGELLLLLHSLHNSSSASAACQATTSSSSTASHRPLKTRATTAPPARRRHRFVCNNICRVPLFCVSNALLFQKPTTEMQWKNVECPTYQSGVGGACPITHLRAPINAKDYTTIKWATLTICAIEWRGGSFLWSISPVFLSIWELQTLLKGLGAGGDDGFQLKYN